MQNDKVILEIKTPRNTEETSEAMAQFLSSLVNLKRQILYFYKRGIPISLEIATFEQRTHFFIVVPQKLQTFIEGQLTAQYPKALIVRNKDYLPDILNSPGQLYEGRLKLKQGF
jgi:hypothetical protein